MLQRASGRTGTSVVPSQTSMVHDYQPRPRQPPSDPCFAPPYLLPIGILPYDPNPPSKYHRFPKSLVNLFEPGALAQSSLNKRAGLPVPSSSPALPITPSAAVLPIPSAAAVAAPRPTLKPTIPNSLLSQVYVDPVAARRFFAIPPAAAVEVVQAGQGKRSTHNRNRSRGVARAHGRAAPVPPLPIAPHPIAVAAPPSADVPTDNSELVQSVELAHLLASGNYHACEGVLEVQDPNEGDNEALGWSKETVEGGEAGVEEAANECVHEGACVGEGEKPKRTRGARGKGRRQGPREGMGVGGEWRTVANLDPATLPKGGTIPILPFLAQQSKPLDDLARLNKDLRTTLTLNSPQEVLHAFAKAFPLVELFDGLPQPVAQLLESVSIPAAQVDGLVVEVYQCLPPAGYTPLARGINGAGLDRGATAKLIRAEFDWQRAEYERDGRQTQIGIFDCFAPCVAELLHQMHTEEKGHDTSQRLFPPERLVQRYSVEMLDFTMVLLWALGIRVLSASLNGKVANVAGGTMTFKDAVPTNHHFLSDFNTTSFPPFASTTPFLSTRPVITSPVMFSSSHASYILRATDEGLRASYFLMRSVQLATRSIVPFVPLHLLPTARASMSLPSVDLVKSAYNHLRGSKLTILPPWDEALERHQVSTEDGVKEIWEKAVRGRVKKTDESGIEICESRAWVPPTLSKRAQRVQSAKMAVQRQGALPQAGRSDYDVGYKFMAEINAFLEEDKQRQFQGAPALTVADVRLQHPSIYAYGAKSSDRDRWVGTSVVLGRTAVLRLKERIRFDAFETVRRGRNLIAATHRDSSQAGMSPEESERELRKAVALLLSYGAAIPSSIPLPLARIEVLKTYDATRLASIIRAFILTTYSSLIPIAEVNKDEGLVFVKTWRQHAEWVGWPSGVAKDWMFKKSWTSMPYPSLLKLVTALESGSAYLRPRRARPTEAKARMDDGRRARKTANRAARKATREEEEREEVEREEREDAWRSGNMDLDLTL